MKYVKLFESWLNEDASKLKRSKGKGNLWSAKNAPQDAIWDGPGGKLDFDALSTYLGKANQDKEAILNNPSNWNHDSQIGLVPLNVSYGYGKDEKSLDFDGSTLDLGGYDLSNFQFSKIPLASENKEKEPVFYSFALARTQNEAEGYLKKAGGKKGAENKIKDYGLVLIVPAYTKYFERKGDAQFSKILVGADGKIAPANMFGLMLFIIDGFNLSDAKYIYSMSKGENLDKFSDLFMREEGKTYKYIEPGGGGRSLGFNTLNTSVVVTTANGSEIVGQLNFPYNKYELTNEAKKTLQESAIKNALTKATKSIEIVGHADGAGGDSQSNVRLSENRAKAVDEMLKTLDWWKEVKVKPTVKGMGIKQPIMDDDKGKEPIAAAANRRVEFIIDGNKPNYDKIIETLEKLKSQD